MLRSGVPQGSALGPLFFIIFINDLAEILAKCGIMHLMYADDLTIFLKIKSAEDSTRLQTGLDCLYKWSSTWDLRLNPLRHHVHKIEFRFLLIIFFLTTYAPAGFDLASSCFVVPRANHSAVPGRSARVP